MVWTQDRLHDRQRVVHWDLSGGQAGGPARRLVDMYSAGEQRVYEPRDRGRLLYRCEPRPHPLPGGLGLHGGRPQGGAS